jgi:hypothetical protein
VAARARTVAVPLSVTGWGGTSRDRCHTEPPACSTVLHSDRLRGKDQRNPGAVPEPNRAAGPGQVRRRAYQRFQDNNVGMAASATGASTLGARGPGRKCSYWAGTEGTPGAAFQRMYSVLVQVA